MSNTFSQIHIHIVFSVKGRKNYITEYHREELEKYICGIISNDKCKTLAIYCNPDHTHVLIGLNPAISISDLLRDIKANSSKFINEKKWLPDKFNWQDGYGAFTYQNPKLIML
jgi:putative transposase